MLHQWTSEYFESSGTDESHVRILSGYMEISRISYRGIICFCTIIARAFWTLKQFSKRVNFQKKEHGFLFPCQGSNLGRHCPQMVSLPLELSCFNIYNLHIHVLRVNIYHIFNPWWMFSPCNLLMCTNKTCFAGVETRPKTIFRIRISFRSYPCESKKIQIFCQQIRLRFPVQTRCFQFLNGIWFLFCYRKFSLV